MLLAVDVGNTNVVFALFEGRRIIRARWRIATDPRRTGDEYAVWLLQLLEIEGVERGDSRRRIIFDSVVPRARSQPRRAGEKYFGVDAADRRAKARRTGVSRSMSTSRTSLGADRALNCHRRACQISAAT